MGSGSWTATSFSSYSRSKGCDYDEIEHRSRGQVFTASSIDESLDPRKGVIRECANSDEHPNTIPVILALDVTGSMGEGCKECAETLNKVMEKLYSAYKDVEFCVMGIGDLAYDDYPLQVSQFESDIRIAESMDKVYMEHGGGGNDYESYSLAWYFGLHNTKLDCFDKQGRKGIIITMGDECPNPYLPYRELNRTMHVSEQKDVETDDLYRAASEKFDIYHIGVNAPSTSFAYNSKSSNNFQPWKKLLGQNYMESTINQLSETICKCIDRSRGASGISFGEPVNEDNDATDIFSGNKTNENGEIAW